MEDISLHILDIVENAIRANAKTVKIEISENKNIGCLIISIMDDGKGMDEETARKALDPFFTTKSGKKVGLGLALLFQAARETGGNLKIESTPDKGTTVTASFSLSHPDMKPLGDIYETLATLITGRPSVHFIYDYKTEDNHFHFDSKN